MVVRKETARLYKVKLQSKLVCGDWIVHYIIYLSFLK